MSHDLSKFKLRLPEFFNDGTCWRMILNSFSQLFIDDTPSITSLKKCPNFNFLPSFLLHRSSLEVRVQLFHLGLIISTLDIGLANILWDVLVLMSTLDIAPANILRDALVLLNVADVHQCNKVDLTRLSSSFTNFPVRSEEPSSPCNLPTISWVTGSSVRYSMGLGNWVGLEEPG